MEIRYYVDVIEGPSKQDAVCSSSYAVNMKSDAEYYFNKTIENTKDLLDEGFSNYREIQLILDEGEKYTVLKNAVYNENKTNMEENA